MINPALNLPFAKSTMQVDHVVPHIYEEASGPSFTVTSLCQALSHCGAKVGLHVLEPKLTSETEFRTYAYPARSYLARLGISPSMARALTEVARKADVLHNHSLWMMPNVYPEAAIRGGKCKLVVSPRGTLSPWALRQSRWKKALMWRFCQERAVRASDCLHATCQEELRDIRRLGLTMPVAVIPNGVYVPEEGGASAMSGEAIRRLLFLSRVHPKKGIDLLLRAWSRLEHDFFNWQLDIAGPDNGGHLRQMQRLARDLELKRVNFLGPVYGQEKEELYRSAELFVLPTRSENFGVAVAEALSQSVPVITTHEAPWQGLIENECGWWIPCDVEALERTLREGLSLSAPELRKYGQRGQAWMRREFSWKKIGEMMYSTYHWLVGGGMAPPWVETT